MKGNKPYVAGLTYKFGKTLKPTFEDITNYYFSDPTAKAAVDELGESTAGHGMEITGKNESAVRTATDFCETIELDELNLEWAKELWAVGNVLFQLLDPAPQKIRAVTPIPISTIKRIYAEADGTITAFDQQIEGRTAKKLDTADGSYVFWRWNRFNRRMTGVGLLECLLRDGMGYYWEDSSGKTYFAARPSFQQSLERMEDSMRKAVEKYTPKYTYKFLGFKDTDMTAHKAAIESSRPEDDLLLSVPNKDHQDIVMQVLSTDPRNKLEPFIQHFVNARTLALQTPVLQLFIEAGFTEASARQAVAVLDRKIEAMQRFMRRNIEGTIIKPYVMQQERLTLDEYKLADLNVNWKQIDKPKMSSGELIQILQLSATSGTQYITPEEARKILAKEFGLPLDLTAKAVVVKQPVNTNTNENPTGVEQ